MKEPLLTVIPVSEQSPVAASRELAFNQLAARDLAASLPGVGDVLAARIVEHRSQHGPFESAQDLACVRGMGQRRAARLWALVVGDAHAETEPGRAPSSPAVSFREEPLDQHQDWQLDEWALQPLPSEREPLPVSASDLPPPPPTRGPFPQAVEPPRRHSFRLAAVGLVALLSGMLGVGVLMKVVGVSRARDTAQTDALRADLGALRGDVERLSSAQAQGAHAETSASARMQAIEKRQVEQDQAHERTDKRLAQAEEQAKKVEEKVDKQAVRISKTEDDLAWQKMVTSAQLATLKRQVKTAADQIEGLASGD